MHFDEKHTGVLVLSPEITVNEELPCDRNRFLVGISNLKKFGSFHVAQKKRFWILSNQLLA